MAAGIFVAFVFHVWGQNPILGFFLGCHLHIWPLGTADRHAAFWGRLKIPKRSVSWLSSHVALLDVDVGSIQRKSDFALQNVVTRVLPPRLQLDFARNRVFWLVDLSGVLVRGADFPSRTQAGNE